MALTRIGRDVDFEDFSWHDCHLWGLALGVGDPDRGDWSSDLILDIDYILEWVCGVGSAPARFRVAPADLAFHDVTDLTIDLAWPDAGGQVAVSLPSIDAIARERVADQRVHLDRPYYRWEIRFNWPAGGAIRFSATGFTQTLRAAPALLEQQHLGRGERRPGGG